MTEHIPEAAVEALARARNCSVIGLCKLNDGLGCGCRRGLAAALPHLVSDGAVERAARAVAATDSCPPGKVPWGDLDQAERAQYRCHARAALRSLGIQDEQEEVEG